MIKSKYIYCINKLEFPEPYILCAQAPFYLGKVVMLDSAIAWAEWSNNFKGLAFSQIRGYRIAIAFAGVLGSRTMPVDTTIIRRLQTVMDEMADFYLQHTIDPKPQLFKKFLFTR